MLYAGKCDIWRMHSVKVSDTSWPCEEEVLQPCGIHPKFYYPGAVVLQLVCHMLYHSHLSITFYTTPICLSHAIPLSSVYHMLYHCHMSITCYTPTICLSYAIPLSSVCHMRCHFHLRPRRSRSF
jgi:hypothetical protein